MAIFSLRNKVNDLFARSNHYKNDVYKADRADAASAEADSKLLADDTASAELGYGVIDLADKHPDEKQVYIPQGSEMVAVWFNPSTRDVRPIPRNIK